VNDTCQQQHRVICFALPFEAAGFFAPPGWEVWTLGCAGGEAEKKFRRRAQAQPPAFCILAGLAGGLHPDLHAADIILDTAEDARISELPAGRVHTCERIVQAAADKATLRIATGADVCDLETARLRRVASDMGFPLWSLRSVSDTASQDLPIPSRLLCRERDGCTDLPGLIAWLLRHPSCWPDFLQMTAHARAARKSLHAALHVLMQGLNAEVVRKS